MDLYSLLVDFIVFYFINISLVLDVIWKFNKSLYKATLIVF